MPRNRIVSCVTHLWYSDSGQSCPGCNGHNPFNNVDGDAELWGEYNVAPQQTHKVDHSRIIETKELWDKMERALNMVRMPCKCKIEWCGPCAVNDVLKLIKARKGKMSK